MTTLSANNERADITIEGVTERFADVFEDAVRTWNAKYEEKYPGWREHRYKAQFHESKDHFMLHAHREWYMRETGQPLHPACSTGLKLEHRLSKKLRLPLRASVDLYETFSVTLLPGEYIRTAKLCTYVDLPSQLDHLAAFAERGEVTEVAWSAGARLTWDGPETPPLLREYVPLRVLERPGRKFRFFEGAIPAFLFLTSPLSIELDIRNHRGRPVDNGNESFDRTVRMDTTMLRVRAKDDFDPDFDPKRAFPVQDLAKAVLARERLTRNPCPTVEHPL